MQETEQKFKVGDKVKIKESMWKGIDTLKYGFTKEGVYVVSRYVAGEYPSVSFEELPYLYDAAHFELVEVIKPQRFQVGDRVISTRDTPSVPEGFVGVVVENDQSNYEYAVKDTLGHTEYFNEDELELLSVASKVNPVEAKPASALDKQVSGNHYKDCGIQPIEYIHANGLSYFQGNVVKYVTRYKDKAGKADLLKAIHYLELMIELEYPDE